MNKFHSTVSRRTFMKGLGLAGAGLGAAAATAPVFHDLDEVAASPLSHKNKRPWYVREVDEPTVEVDWPQKPKWSEVNTMRGSAGVYMRTYISAEEEATRKAMKAEQELQWRISGKPGWSLKDYSFKGSAGQGAVSNVFMAPEEDYRGRATSTPESYGVPKWTGTKDEAAAMLRTVGRFFGALSIGFTELDSATTEKFIYSYEPGGKEEVTWKADGPFEIKNVEHAHPLDARWVITMVNMESQHLWKRSNTQLQVQIRYPRAANIQARFQMFMRSIGYDCLSEGGNGTGVAPAFAVMAGLGELGRINRLITPEYGPTVGVFRYITNLPLPNEKPIDAGIFRFCHTCKKCAEACGEGSVSMADEPFWDPAENSSPYDASKAVGHDQSKVPGANPPKPGGWHQGGGKAFYEDSRKCRSWKMYPNTCNAGRCFGVCTFTKYHIAGIHEVVSSTLSVTPVFNGFLRTMDDVFGYGLVGRRHDDYTPGDAATDAAVEKFWTDTPAMIYGIPSEIGL